jgi:hypothetical protein
VLGQPLKYEFKDLLYCIRLLLYEEREANLPEQSEDFMEHLQCYLCLPDVDIIQQARILSVGRREFIILYRVSRILS